MTLALVTGGARRLGRAMALTLAEEGHDVAVHYAGAADKADTLVAEIIAMGRRAAAFEADLTVEAEMQALVPEVVARMGGPVEVLVNNASIFEYDTVQSATRESWDRHLESNLRAPFVLTQAVAEGLPEAGQDANGEPVVRGLIVNMIDQRVRKLTPEFATYTIAKMGLWALTRSSAQALAGTARVNAIGPGPTLRGARQSEAHFARQRAGTIMGRGANPEDICGALRYLLSARAVTGQLICVDGGQHLGWQTPDIVGVE